MLTEVLKHIEERNRFVLTSHARPDGDAVGSALACWEILRSMGKDAEVVLRDGVPRIYHPLPFADKVVQSDSVNGSYDAAIILECDSIQRTRLEGLDGRFLINIDHHKSGRTFADVNWIDPKAVATAEMVYKLARAAGVKISPEIATCLYTAVLTDTGAFMLYSTWFVPAPVRMSLSAAVEKPLVSFGIAIWSAALIQTISQSARCASV